MPPEMTIIGKLTAPVPTMSAGSHARSYCAAARQFVLGVDALSKGDSSLSPACAFLAAQSLECLLKAYLAKSGFPLRQLKQAPLRHNLEALWAVAHERGLGVSAQAPQWCQILNQTHDTPYHLRYPLDINYFQTPAYQPMVSELGSLQKLIQSAVSS